MKRVLLCMLSGIASLSTFAQQQKYNSVAFTLFDINEAQALHQPVKPEDVRAGKTTTGITSRWYNYSDWLDLSTSGKTAFSSPYMWNDTTSQDFYSGGTVSHNRYVSVATVIDPYYAGFYDELYYPSTDYMVMTSSKAYTVDSLTIYGFYGKNPAKTNIVDTVIVGYTYGTGLPLTNSEDIWRDEFDASFASSVLTRYNLATTDTLWFKQLFYDSTKNTGGGTHFKKQVITISYSGSSTSTTANWGDTLSNGLFAKRFALTTPMNVPAGSMIGVTISFKSGDPSFVADDTVYMGSTAATPYKYHMFRPLLAYNTTSAGGSTADYAKYSPTDNNIGMFKTLPNFANGWKNVYIPMWAWTANGGPSTLQYPYVDAHIKCPSCTTTAVKDIRGRKIINAFPNPAINELKISFDLASVHNTSVTLTNMMGSVVAEQKMGSISNGVAIFNTNTLPAGIYIYTVAADGERSVGRVVVAH